MFVSQSAGCPDRIGSVEVAAAISIGLARQRHRIARTKLDREQRRDDEPDQFAAHLLDEVARVDHARRTAGKAECADPNRQIF
jgi:hypothetical protein